jgi:hypothetical protein
MVSGSRAGMTYKTFSRQGRISGLFYLMGITFYRRRKMLEKLDEAKEQAKKLDEKADSFLMKLIDSPWTGLVLVAVAVVFVFAVIG